MRDDDRKHVHLALEETHERDLTVTVTPGLDHPRGEEMVTERIRRAIEMAAQAQDGAAEAVAKDAMILNLQRQLQQAISALPTVTKKFDEMVEIKQTTSTNVRELWGTGCAQAEPALVTRAITCNTRAHFYSIRVDCARGYEKFVCMVLIVLTQRFSWFPRGPQKGSRPPGPPGRIAAQAAFLVF
jgi:hypothetical protein